MFFMSDNVGEMNVTTTQFVGTGKFLTLVTNNGQPWDFIEALDTDSAKQNHLAFMLACATYGLQYSGTVDASTLN